MQIQRSWEHEIHAEFIDVSIGFIQAFLTHKETKDCVGTTSLRTLESLYWMGVKAMNNPKINLEEIKITQWDAYDLPQDIPTKLLIAPGYKIRTVDTILTNFHQPE